MPFVQEGIKKGGHKIGIGNFLRKQNYLKYMNRCLILLMNRKIKPAIKRMCHLSDWQQCEILTMLLGVKDSGKEVLC